MQKQQKAKQESFASMLDETFPEVYGRRGAMLTAEVVAVDRNFIILATGLKSDAIVDASEFMTEDGKLEVEVGDYVRTMLMGIEDGYGHTSLSRAAAKRHEAWEAVQAAFADGTPITGIVTGKVKGGLAISVGVLRGFLPNSHADVKSGDVADLVGKTLDFKILKVDEERENVVVSRRALTSPSTDPLAKAAMLDSLRVGSVVEGTVKAVVDYGAFVDIGGVDGLLHVSDMAWKRPAKASEMIEQGQKITVMVLRIDRDKGRVALGLKQLADDPWDGAERRYQPGARVIGKVTRICDYGAFVETIDGLEGLAHVSEMDWIARNPDPAKIVSIGDDIEAIVVDCDPSKRRLGLSLRRARPNPWEEFAAENSVGSNVKGVVKSITDFGVFFTLPGGLDGLARTQDLDGELPAKGDSIELEVVSLDSAAGKIGLASVGLSDERKAAAEAAALRKAEAASAGSTNLGSLLKDKLGR